MEHSIRWNPVNTKAMLAASEGGHAVNDPVHGSGRWVHATLEQVQDLFPDINFGRYCETPRCHNNLHRAAVFEAVVYRSHSDCWIACLPCHEIMLRELTGKKSKPRIFRD